MMSKEQYIKYWLDTAQYDWTGVEDAFNAKRYIHCLFWAHLTLEKLAKAHWVKTHIDNIPPKVHNVVAFGRIKCRFGERDDRFSGRI